MKRNLRITAAFLAAAIMTFASCNKKAETQDNSAAAGKAEAAAKNAKPNPESDFEIKISDDLTFVKVTGYNGKSKKVVVPETIQGLPVMYVDLNAPEAALLVIPSTTKLISVSVGDAWEKKKNYADIVLPEGLLAIRRLGGKISQVTLPSTVKYIGMEACTTLATKKLVLPPSLEFIGRDAFGAYENYDFIYKDNLTLPSPGGKLILCGYEQFYNINNLLNLPENLESNYRWISDTRTGSKNDDYGNISWREFMEGHELFRGFDKGSKSVGSFMEGSFKDKINQSVELKKKFDLNREIPPLTREESKEFQNSLRETLKTLPKELTEEFYFMFSNYRR